MAIDFPYSSEKRINLVPNPSFENDTVGWVAFDSTGTRDTSQFFLGIASFKLVGNGSQVYCSGKIRVPVTNSVQYTMSYYAKATVGTPNARATLNWYNANGIFISQSQGASTALTTSWQRRTVTATAPATATSVDVYVECPSGVSLGTTVFADAFLLEESAFAGSYFDGSSVNGVWAGTPHNSASQLNINRTNFVTNPSFETDLNGWSSGQTGTVRSTDFAYSDTNSYKITCNTLDSNVAYISSIGITTTGLVTTSVYVYTPVGSTIAGRTISMSVEGGTATSTLITSSPATLVAGRWVRVSYVRNVTAVGTWVVVFRLSGTMSTANGQLVYFDAALIENAPIPLPYFDGTTTGASWTGTAHASTSTLPPPTIGQTYNVIGKTWTWNGTVWVVVDKVNNASNQIYDMMVVMRMETN